MRVITVKRLLVVALVTTGAAFLLAGNAGAQQPGACQPWINQASWNGTITLEGDGEVVLADGSTVKVHESATVNFTTDNPPGDGCFDNQPLNWIAGVNGIKSYSVNLNDETDVPCLNVAGMTINKYQVTNGTYDENAELVIDPFAGTYQLTMTPAANGVVATSTDCQGSPLPPSTRSSWIYGPNKPYMVSGIPLPTTGLTLSGSVSYPSPVSVLENFNDPPITWTVTWNLTPVPKNLDLVVTIPNYPTWRPAGGKTEKDIGTDPVSGLSVLELDAQFIDKDTGLPSTVPPDKITFSLADVSHEPGVSMNWPDKNTATKDADLAFDDVHNPTATLGANGTKADFVPLNSSPVAAFVSPHDWGAWATLNVTATFDGKTYQGHLKGEATTNVLLPKRQTDSHVADTWKTKHNVPLSTPDTEDAEADPVSYPGCVGDGLTVYEEYRGFMENSKHIEGDISAKDFFIQNLIGGNAEPGIAQFTELTGLIVHKDIQKDEMEGVNGATLGDRLINFNHAQGAHVTEQHGVLIGTCNGTNGGDTYIRTNNGQTLHGRPGLTNGICMQGRNSPGTLNPGETHRGTISTSDAASQFDLGVAHEFLHSVGVSHHGETDDGSHLFTLLGPDDPRNTKKVPAFLLDGAIVSLLDEVTLADRASAMWDRLADILVKNCGSVDALYGPAAFSTGCATVVNHGLREYINLVLYIGHPQAQHSGDDHCVMRYFFANAYPKTGDTSIYYISKSGTEPKGDGLCISPTGTGINSSSHQPQSRYSDARGGRGACQNWVCVNDKYPPIPD